MAIDERHRQNLEAYLNDIAEAADMVLDANTFPVLLYQEWENVIDADALERDRVADNRELKRLEEDIANGERELVEAKRRRDELKNPRPRGRRNAG